METIKSANCSKKVVRFNATCLWTRLHHFRSTRVEAAMGFCIVLPSHQYTNLPGYCFDVEGNNRPRWSSERFTLIR